MTWSELRATRALRPGFAAASGVRANIYGAALEQAEQLFAAATSAGTATSPILLFYGTAQLGRAIVAASPEVPNSSARVQGHGGRAVGIEASTVRLADMSVSGGGDERTSLGSLSRVLGCCALERPRRLDDLISRIPIGQLFLRSDTLPKDGGGPAEPMFVVDPRREVEAGAVPWMVQGPGMLRIVVHPVPRTLAPKGIGAPLDEPREWPEGEPRGVENDTVETARTVRDLLAEHFDRYPGLAGWQFNMNAASTVPVVQNLQRGFSVALEVPIGEGEHNLAIPERMAPRFNDALVLYPGVDGCGQPDHPLVLWWAVLLVLSSLARYHPDAWLKLTHIDKHEDASVIEQMLVAAADEVPRLALAALTGERMKVG